MSVIFFVVSFFVGNVFELMCEMLHFSKIYFVYSYVEAYEYTVYNKKTKNKYGLYTK